MNVGKVKTHSELNLTWNSQSQSLLSMAMGVSALKPAHTLFQKPVFSARSQYGRLSVLQ